MSQELYCICRSKDSGKFMICCENCEVWFHGKCVNVTKKEADKIDNWYCETCMTAKPSLKIVYKPGQAPTPAAPQPPKKPVQVKQEPLEERKQEKKVSEKNLPATTLPKPRAKAVKAPQIKTESNKRRVNQKAKFKGQVRKQCSNPDCIYEARADSKYCSDECGYAFNKLRYVTHFIPKWQNLSKDNHSKARMKKMRELDQLEKDKCDAEQLIKNLKLAKEELEENILIIKEQAKKLYEENKNLKRDNDDNDADMDNEDTEIISGDAALTFCITCGNSILRDIFRHWSSCHKKHEDLYNFTADVIFKHSYCKEDEDPKLYCQHPDKVGKKGTRFCMNLASACPQHTNWQSDKNEVCGCPLIIMQKLVPDGNYCLELKKDCAQHYHWDKFRLAQINVQRVAAFTRLDSIIDRIDKTSKSLEDTYGGVVGVMLHNTLDHQNKSEKEGSLNNSPQEQEEINVDMMVD